MATNNELSIKLLINKKTGKLCFAEAGSDVVEFLKGLLSLPLGTVTSLLAKEGMGGSVGTLLGSAEKLGANYNIKDQHLSPAVAAAALSHLLRLLGVQTSVPPIIYICAGTYSGRISCGHASMSQCSRCPGCGGGITYATLPTAAPAAAAGTTTLPTPTYTIKDDLSMTPAASMTVITLLAECGVNDPSVLQEKIVKIGRREALGILSAAFKSKTVLTDVFLPKKNARCKREAPEEVIHI